MSKKVKPVKKSAPNAKATDSSIDLAPMRQHIDGIKNEVNTLPDGAQKTALLSKLEEFYFWTGNFVRGIAGASMAATPA